MARRTSHPAPRTAAFLPIEARLSSTVVLNRGRMDHESVPEQFTAALAELVDQVKGDRSVLAAVLCGSLSHDTVWEKSDIDLVLVTIDDKNVEPSDVALYARSEE